jgi:hypothetical protein
LYQGIHGLELILAGNYSLFASNENENGGTKSYRFGRIVKGFDIVCNKRKWGQDIVCRKFFESGKRLLSNEIKSKRDSRMQKCCGMLH